jgi:mono/diheme cytochrome c family protein
MIAKSMSSCAALVVALYAGGALAQTGGYTEAQAARGTATFNANCSLCHGENLAGGPGTPALAGPEFMFGWKAKTAADLSAYIKTNMPPGSPGGLSDRQYADLTAVILKANDHPPGDTELAPDPAAQKAVLIAGAP